jgi:hypothetical protein
MIAPSDPLSRLSCWLLRWARRTSQTAKRGVAPAPRNAARMSSAGDPPAHQVATSAHHASTDKRSAGPRQSRGWQRRSAGSERMITPGLMAATACSTINSVRRGRCTRAGKPPRRKTREHSNHGKMITRTRCTMPRDFAAGLSADPVLILGSTYLNAASPQRPCATADSRASQGRRRDSHCPRSRSATRRSRPAELSRNPANGPERPQRPGRRTSEAVSRS